MRKVKPMTEAEATQEELEAKEILNEFRRDQRRYVIRLLAFIIIGAVGLLCLAGLLKRVSESNKQDAVVHCRKATYEGHRYLFLHTGASTLDAGVVHDPDCPCQNTKGKSK